MKAALNYNEVLGPRLYIVANGKLAEDITQNIVRFEYGDDEKKANHVNITVANSANKFTDDPRFQKGVTFSVCWGYPTDISRIQHVVITKARPSFKSSGPFTMDMAAFDIRYEMAKISNPTNWGAISSSEVAKKVAKRYEFQTDIENSNDARRQARIQAAGTNDILFLQTLANKLNWDFYIEGNVLHFHSKRLNTSPLLEYTYFIDPTSTLIEFIPEVDLNKPPKVKGVGSDHKNNKTNGKSTDGSDNGAVKYGERIWCPPDSHMIGRFRIGPPPGDPMTKPSAETDKKVIDAHTNALSQKIDMNAVKATMKVVGTPKLKARDNVRILGVGRTYSGNWRIASTRHIIEGKGGSMTYITEVKLTRNALGGGKATDKSKNANNKGGQSDDKARGPRSVPISTPPIDTSGFYSGSPLSVEYKKNYSGT